MCIWNVSEEKRMCGFCLFRRCKKRHRPNMNPSEVGARYVHILQHLSGVNALEKNRKREVVWCRNMVALQMSLEGFSQEKIGDFLGLNRATIVHCVSSMVSALDNPGQYLHEVEIWNKFREKISLKKN